MSEITYYSKEGLDKIKKELNELKNVTRRDITEQIAEARDKGDLSENAEYDAAKDKQAMVEYKISQLETIVAHARILDKKNLDHSKTHILSTVEIKNHNTKKKVKYTLVAESEADFKIGKISIKSPIGKALIGKEKGDIVDVKVPAGTLKLEILNILED
ncbi:MAG: transcription elongation factor GreA [Bacteroidota bacterium]|nr:transcription elongation factor GreA [Bacteroidota bacterium]